MSKCLDSFRPDVLAARAGEVAKDFSSVAVYFFSHSEFKRPLTRAEAVALSKAGLYIVSVYENGQPTNGDYFSTGKGAYDAEVALRCAEEVGQPAGGVIYFAVDYDAAESDLAAIAAYFAAVQPRLKAAGYSAGVYGSGLACKRLSGLGLVSHTWLSESQGFAGYADWASSANIIQSPSGPYLGIDIDMDRTDGNAGGWQVAQ